MLETTRTSKARECGFQDEWQGSEGLCMESHNQKNLLTLIVQLLNKFNKNILSVEKLSTDKNKKLSTDNLNNIILLIENFRRTRTTQQKQQSVSQDTFDRQEQQQQQHHVAQRKSELFQCNTFSFLILALMLLLGSFFVLCSCVA